MLNQMDSQEFQELHIDDDQLVQSLKPSIQNPFSFQQQQQQVQGQEQEQMDLVESQIMIRRRTFKLEVAVQPGVIQYYENVNYTVLSQLEDEPSSTVTRSYTHFEWLSEILSREHLGIIIPSIPKKAVQAKINVSNQQTKIIRDQRFVVDHQNQIFLKGLHEFLRKVLNHPTLSYSPHVETFFKADQNVIQQEVAKFEQFQPYTTQVGNWLFNAGSSVFGLASKSVQLVTSYIGNSQQQCQSEIRKQFIQTSGEDRSFFDEWEKVLAIEKTKLNQIFDHFVFLAVNKSDQVLNMQVVSKILKQENNEGIVLLSEKMDKQNGETEVILQEIKRCVNYPIEQYILDIDQALKLLNMRNELITDINGKIKLHNENKFKKKEEIVELEQEIDQKIKKLENLSKNLKQDIPVFGNTLNNELCQVINKFYVFQKELAMRINQIWKEEKND